MSRATVSRCLTCSQVRESPGLKAGVSKYPDSPGLKPGGLRKGRARGIEIEDFSDFDLILVMDFDNQSEVMTLKGDHSGTKGDVRLFCEFCESFDDQVVPDPYYGGPEGFEKVLDLIEDGCQGIVNWYRKSER